MYEDIQEDEVKIHFKPVKQDSITKQDVEMLGQRIAEIGKKMC
jgi:protein tyrosine phosphatase (PTP) superfamily phosphohydrolase (DUF442 family)